MFFPQQAGPAQLSIAATATWLQQANFTSKVRSWGVDFNGN